jgi:hypothetical protein
MGIKVSAKIKLQRVKNWRIGRSARARLRRKFFRNGFGKNYTEAFKLSVIFLFNGR